MLTPYRVSNIIIDIPNYTASLPFATANQYAHMLATNAKIKADNNYHTYICLDLYDAAGNQFDGVTESIDDAPIGAMELVTIPDAISIMHNHFECEARPLFHTGYLYISRGTEPLIIIELTTP